MDRGDAGFVIHESFKDLKARRAEQEAYRKALEEQIAQKRKLQEQDRQKYEGRRSYSEAMPTHVNHAPQRVLGPTNNQSPCIQPAQEFGGNNKPSSVAIIGTPQSTPVHIQSRPPSRGRVHSLNEGVNNFKEPHWAITTNVEDKFVQNIPTPPPPPPPPPPPGIPQFSPQCIKYLQQVMPGFTLPPLPTTPIEYADSTSLQTAIGHNNSITREPDKMTLMTPETNSSYVSDRDQAFSSGTSSESSSMEDVQSQTKAKFHVSQTSEQLEGVKVSRKQYREELQKQIDERKRREEELRRKAEEEEERIQEKIRIQQEKMQREYEEELKKLKEEEVEAEKKRLATLAKQKDIIRVHEESKSGKKDKLFAPRLKSPKGKDVQATVSSSEESIESIGEFFDETTITQRKFVNPDDRIIPVVAKRLREKSIQKENRTEELQGENTSHCKMSLTARIDPVAVVSNASMTIPHGQGPPPPQPGLIREMAIRSAPGPPTTSSNDLQFLSTLKNYLQTEKNKLDERKLARISKSTEKF